MSDLDQTEQGHVRAALRVLRRRFGTWAAVADGMHTSPKTLEGVIGGRAVSASVAFKVSRLAGVMIDDLLVGKFVPPGACPNCGYVASSDFKDESTIVEDARAHQPSES